MEGFMRARAPRENIDAVRHHEGRIKSDPELTDQIEFFAPFLAFHGVPAIMVSNSSTKIVTTVPVGATSGHITVTTSAGTATSNGTFRVT